MELVPRFSTEEIHEAVQRIAGEISTDHEGHELLLVGILTGSFVFLADLIRAMTIPLQVDFIRARSYGTGTHSSGAVEITKDIETDITDRHVVVVEDILDTGLTVDVVTARLRAGRPASVSTCALLVREGSPEPDYMGLWTPRGFVVGYGIDFAERYRELPEIWAIPGT